MEVESSVNGKKTFVKSLTQRFDSSASPTPTDKTTTTTATTSTGTPEAAAIVNSSASIPLSIDSSDEANDFSRLEVQG